MILVRVRDKEPGKGEPDIILRSPIDAREIVTTGKGRFELADEESVALVPGLVPPPQSKPEGDALNVKIMAAITKLDQKEGFNAEGEPSLFALESVLGFVVTADERDAAWMDYELAAQAKAKADKSVKE